MGLLEDILKNKRKEVEEQEKRLPFSVFYHLMRKHDRIDLSKVFPEGEINIIGEIKRMSPSSKGEIIPEKDYNPAEIAKIYDKYCCAVSVLTDKKYFGGDNADLVSVQNAIDKPVLRKDFILPEKLGEYQIRESRLLGANFILLIARILERKDIEYFIKLANDYGMKCIVEADSKKELRKAIDSGAEIIGVNNRNLDTLQCDLRRSIELYPLIPEDKIGGVESGIKGRDDIELLHYRGIYPNFILTGTGILTSENMEGKLRELKGV